MGIAKDAGNIHVNEPPRRQCGRKAHDAKDALYSIVLKVYR